jgi:DNA-directed RNA polymerase subunit M/transcription elongation factor TFIIS
MFKLTIDPEKFRYNIQSKINNFIDHNTISINIEKGIYNYTIKKCDELNIVKKWENSYFIKIYINKFKSIYFNLQNNNIVEKLKNKTIKSYHFSEMNQQELFPEKWKIILEELKIKNENKYIPKIQASTDDFECYKCKSVEISNANKEKRKPIRDNYTQCTYYQLQTRSADEPMTTFVTCIKCGTRFKC